MIGNVLAKEVDVYLIEFLLHKKKIFKNKDKFKAKNFDDKKKKFILIPNPFKRIYQTYIDEINKIE